MSQSRTQQHLLSLLDPEHLELILLPTEQCNFRCTYCYEDFTIGRMKPETIRGIHRLLDTRAPRLRSLALSWFGGEPLAARDVVLDISRHARDLAERHPQLRYHGSMTTNGYRLDPTTALALHEVGVRSYQITLDGWGTGHDQTRRRADGGGTFERIWKHLCELQRSSLEIGVLIRVHLQPHSIESVTQLERELHARFAGDPRFDLHFKAIGNWGGPNSGKFDVLSRAEAKERAAKLQERWRAQCAARRPAPQGEPNLEPAPEPLPYVCYAARPNSLMIRANGRIGKCTVMMTDDRNSIGSIRPDGTLSFEPGRLAPWMHGFRSGDRGALSCPASRLPREASTQTLPLV